MTRHVLVRVACSVATVIAALVCPAGAAAQMVWAPATGGNPQVLLIDDTGTRAIQAYDALFRGGVRATLGDVNGDGTLDIITGAGPGGGPHVRVISGADLSELASFYAYDPAFAGGVTVAAGDVNRDGRADIITGAGPGGGPHVRVISGADLSELASFYAYNPAFDGGVSVAAGDVNGDGRVDIITGAGPGGGPHVRAFSGTDLSELASFYAYNPAFAGGVQVAAGDINGDGLSDIITGAGPTGGPHVRVISVAGPTELASFYAYDPTFTGGVYVATGDLNADGRVDIITGAGPGGIPEVRVFSGTDLSELTSFVAVTTGSGVTVGSMGDATLRFTSASSTTLLAGSAGTFTVSTAGLPPGQVATLTLSGPLPAGVTFVDNGNGTATLAGTPGAGTGGEFPLAITASGPAGMPVTQTFALTVTEAAAITSANATAFAIGLADSLTVTTTGFPNPTITASGTLPAGVTFIDIGDGTATLAGTPDAGTAGTYPLTFTAANGVGTPAIQVFTLTVSQPQAPAITSAGTSTFTVGATGSFTVTTTGAPAPSLTIGGALPFGVTFVDNGNGTGTLAGMPSAGTSGTYLVTFTADNGIGVPAVQSFTLNVNQAPDITSANAVTFTAGSPGTFTVTTSGVPAPALAAGGSALPAGVTFVDNGNGTGTLSGTPGAGTGGLYAITVTATNGVGLPVTQPFTLTVLQAPAITSVNAVTFSIGSPASFTVTTTGFPLPTLIAGGASLPAGVTFVDNGNGTGTLAGTPAAGTGGTYAIAFTAVNGVGVPVVQPFTLTVNALPAFTSASAATFTVGAPASFTVVTSAIPAVTTLTATGALPAGVTFTDLGNGTAALAGTPDPGTAGAYPLTMTADNGVGTASQAFTLTVDGVSGGAPTITSANATTFVIAAVGTFTVTTTGTPAAGTIGATGALPTGVVFTNNGDGTATLAGTPGAGTAGTYPLTFTADNGAGTTNQSFTLTIAPATAAPTFTSATSTTFTVGSSGAFAITTVATPVATVTQAGVLPANIVFTDNGDGTASLTGTPQPGTGGLHTVTFTATNDVGPSVHQTFALIIQEAASISSANSTTFTENVPGTFTVMAAGVPTPALGVTGTLPPGVTFVDNSDGTGTLSGTPAAGSAGTHSLQFTPTNGVGAPVAQAFTLIVNAGLSFTSASATTFTAGSAGTFTVTTIGTPPVTAVTMSGTLPAGVTFVDTLDGMATLGGTPDANTGGVYPLTFTATNGVVNVTQNFVLTVQQASAVTSVNAVTLTVGTAGAFTVTATGFPLPTVTQGGAALPAGVTVVDNGDGTATLSGTPAAGAAGTYALQFTAANGVGAPAVQSFTLTVNDAPSITSANATTFAVGTPGTFTVTTAGVPAPALTHGGVALPAGVTFVDNGNGTGTLSGTPGAGTGGAYAITFTAANGVGANAVQAFTLTVNQAPAITSANSAAFVAGTAGTFTVTTTGFPAPTIVRGGVGLPAGVTFADNGNGTATLSGTPAAGTGGSYAISLTAANGSGPDATQNFTLTIDQSPAVTSANSVAFTIGATGTFTVTTTGVPAPSLAQGGVALPAGVTFVDNGNGTGTLSGTPGAGTGGAYAITFTAANGVGVPATQAFTLTVQQAPTITSANTATFRVGSTGSFTVTTTGLPPPTLTLGGASLPADVTFVDTGIGTGTLAGPPAAGTGGTYAITFTASNGAGVPVVQPFTLIVGDVPALDLDLDDDGGTPPTPGTGFAITFSESSPPQFVQDEVDATITDVDSPDLTSITVTMTNVLDALQEKLDVDLVAGGFAADFTKTFDETTTPGVAVLTITATTPQPLADFNTLLRRVTYQNLDIGPDATTPRTITFVVNDGVGNSNTATTAVTIVAVDQPPTANDDSYSVSEGGTLTVPAPGVLDGDSDPEGDALTAVLVTEPANATAFTLNNDGSFTYTHDGSNTTTDSFTYRTVANGVPSAPATVTITITPVNDPPSITAGGTLNFAEGSPATPIDTTMVVTDDDTNLQSATVQIAANYLTGQDVLAMPVTAGIGSSVDALTGTLTLTGSATVAAYQAALRTVTYFNGSTAPSPLPRTVTWIVNDGTNPSSAATSTITVTPVNTPPTAFPDSGTTTEDTVLNVAAPGVLGNDTDLDLPADIQTVSAVNGVPGNVGTPLTLASGAVVTVNANGSYVYDPSGVAAFQALGQGQSTTDSFTYTLQDAGALPSSATVTITINGVNDVPALDLDADDDGGTPPTTGNDFAITFAESSPPQFIQDEVDATITDVDSPNLTSITVTVTNVLDNLQEKLDVDLVTGGFNVNFTKNFDESTSGIAVLTLTATTPQPLADFNTLLRRVTYQNLDTSADTTAPRTITFVVNDGVGNSTTATTTVTITATDDPPTADNDSYTVAEGAMLTVPAPGVLDGDVDPEGDIPITAVLDTGPANATSFTLNSDGSFTYTHNGSETTTDTFTYRAVANGLQSTPATVTITITAVNDAPAAVDDTNTTTEDAPVSTAAPGVLANDTDPDAGDTRTVVAVNGVPGNVGVATATAKGASVTLNADGSYTYSPGSVFQSLGTGQTDTDTFTYTMQDAAAAPSNIATVTITITGANDAPVVTAGAGSAAFIEEGPAVAVAPGLSVTDGDDTSIESATVQITGNYQNGQDVLAFTNQAGITGVFSAATGTLTLTGSSSVANYQTALQGVTYSNTSQNPSTLLRTVQFQVNDGTVDSNTSPRTVTVAAVNDAPAITAGGTLNFIEGNLATAIDTTILVTDPDDTNLESATVQIAANYVNGQDMLAMPVTAGIASSFNALTGTLTLGGSATVAAYQSALRSVTYFNNSASPSVAPRTVAWVVNDGTASSNIAASTITVTAVNSAPIGAADAWTTFGNTDFVVDQAGPSTPFVADTTTSTFGVLDNDTDVEGDPRVVSGIAGCADTTAPYVCTTTAGGSVTMESNGRFTYRPQAGDTGTDSFQYVLTDVPSAGVAASVNVTVNLTLQERIWYVDGDAVGPGTGTSSNPFSALPATAGDADDYIFVHDSTLTLIGGITLQNGQKLYGEGFGLSINQSLNGNPAPAVLVAPGGSPDIAASTGNTVRVLANTANGSRTNVEIRGLTLATTAASANAIDITSANAANVGVTISGVVVTGATAEGIDINQGSSGTATVSMTNVTVTSTGTGIDLNETAGTLTVTGFNGITITGNTGGSGIVVTNATFDAAAGGAYNQVAGGATAVGDAGNPVGVAGIVLTNVAGDLAFSNLDIFSANGAGLLVSGTGAVNVGAGTGTGVTVASGVGTLQSIGGPVLNITNATVNLPLDSAGVTSSPTTGISLVNVASGTTPASVSATSGSITSTTGISVNVSGGTVSLNYGGNITQTTNVAMVSVSGGHTTGTITFSGTLNATNGPGLVFDNADSTTSYKFTGTTTLNGGDAGIDILNGSAGTFTFGTGTTITNPTGTAFLLSGSNANVAYSGSISDNTGFAVDIDNHDVGTVTFQTGSITSTASGLRVANSNGGTINFNSPTIALTTAGNKAVTLDVGNAGGTINFAPAGGNGLDISTTNGIGFSALGGGTISVSGAGNTINSTGGMAIDIQNATIGAGGVNFATTTSGGGANNVKLASVTGGAIALGSGSLTGATAAAFLVGDSVGTANTGGTSAITYGGTITTTGTRRPVNIQDRAAGAGNITLSGRISHASGNASGIFMDDNAAGTITFSGANSVLNGGTATAVLLTDNTGATINFTGGGLDIDATGASGGGFVATGGGTVSVTGTGNTITTTTSAALNIANTTIGAGGATFQSISSNGAQRGIILNTTGAGAFTVTGTGTTDGSGGTIQASTSRGAEIISANNISLANMNFTGNGTAQTVPGSATTCGGDLRAGNNLSCVSGIHLQSITGVTLTNLNVTNGGQMGINGNAVSNVTLTNSTVTGNGNGSFENGITFQNLTGTNSITDTIVKDNEARQIHVANNSSSSVTLSISGTRTNNAYPAMDTSTTEIGNTVAGGANTLQGILLETFGPAVTANATLNITGVAFNNNSPQNAIHLQPLAGAGSLTGTTTGSSFDTNAAGVIISAQNGSGGTYNITNSEFNRTALQSILYAAAEPTTGTLQGTISGNTIGTAGSSGSACFPTTGSNCTGIDVSFIGGTGAIRLRIQNNTIQQFDGNGIRVVADDGASTGSTMHANVLNNTIRNPLGLNANGIDTNIGTTAGATVQGCISISGNTVTGTYENPGPGELGIHTRVRFLSEHRLPGMTGTGTANAMAFLTAQNPATAASKIFVEGSGVPGYQSGATCTTP